MINTNYTVKNNPQFSAPQKPCLKKAASLKSDSVDISFKGHIGYEMYGKKGIKKLISETAFFREAQTNGVLKEYIINELLPVKEKIKMVVAGCSTGEEAITQSMNLKDYADKISILGFDLSKNSINSALSRKYTLQRQKNAPKDELGIGKILYNGFNDAYLAFETQAPLTKEELANKKLFDEFFEATNEIAKKPKLSLKQRFNNYILQKVFKYSGPIETEDKIYKLKEGAAKNCEFIQGDIRDIDSIVKEDKADVILFRNAFYHLITEDVMGGMLRKLKEDAPETIEKIVGKIKKSFNGEKGVLVLGENEYMQTMDGGLVSSILKKNGFKGLNGTAENEATVWLFNKL